MKLNQSQQFYLAIALIALSRLPFLFFGYGSEEDAWALPLVAERIATTGVYEVSRLPGHPLQELIFTLVWNKGSFVYNFITAIISTIGIIFFMQILQKIKSSNWLWAGIALAATPIIYINSTNAMDYTWAMSFGIISLFYILNTRFILAGIFIGLAVGCRITSGALLLPYCYLIWNMVDSKERIKSISKTIVATGITSLLLFTPVIYTYGLSFFTYYQHFPIPSFAKNFYKGTFAAFGSIGTAAVFVILILFIVRKNVTKHIKLDRNNIAKPFLYSTYLTILLFLIAFIQLPLKAAFIIPVVSAFWLGASIILSKREMKLGALTMIFSCFFFGLNLADPLRGSMKSNLSIPIELSGQKIVLDPIAGTFIADITKRVQRTNYANEIINKALRVKHPTFIIAGWWLADILVLQKGKENSNVTYDYYVSEKELKIIKEKKIAIFFLPEQDTYNDLRFKSTFTKKYASSF